MFRILLTATCLLAMAIPAVAQTLRISLRQDLDVLDPTLTTSYVARIVLAGAVRQAVRHRRDGAYRAAARHRVRVVG